MDIVLVILKEVGFAILSFGLGCLGYVIKLGLGSDMDLFNNHKKSIIFCGVLCAVVWLVISIYRYFRS